MRKKPHALLLLGMLAMLLGAEATHADLGRTKLDYWGEYGLPLNRLADGGEYEGYTFQARDGTTETVVFHEGRVIGIMFVRRDGRSFSELEIQKLLQANADGSRWVKEKFRNVENVEGEGHFWQRKDGDGYAAYFRGKMQGADGKMMPMTTLMVGSRRGGKFFNRLLEKKQGFEWVPYE